MPQNNMLAGQLKDLLKEPMKSIPHTSNNSTISPNTLSDPYSVWAQKTREKQKKNRRKKQLKKEEKKREKRRQKEKRRENV